MGKRTDSLIFKFAIIFTIFTIVTLSISGTNIYFNQMKTYEQDCEKNITNICDYLEKLLQADGDNFVQLQNWWVHNLDNIHIPLSFDGNWQPAKKNFEILFAKNYPGKILGESISFTEMDYEVQKAWAIWQYQHWLYTFEEARNSFQVLYTYYTFPRGEDNHLYYMIDALREPFDNPSPEQEGMIDILDNYNLESLEGKPIYKGAWISGKRISGHDEFNNEYGRNWSYYVPLVIQNQVWGIIGADIAVAKVNRDILKNTMRQMTNIAVTLILSVFFTLLFIYNKYIKKLINLQANVRRYASEKNASIANQIEHDIHGDDEISALSNQVASMIIELEAYIKNLIKTTNELTSTRLLAKEMNELAIKDALTGIRNKTAYDREVSRLSWQIAEGQCEFGIAIIDLNFLKRINDTFGHGSGNEVIKRLCRIICSTFEHSPVFRIGGDEFAVILENQDFKNIDELLKKFQNILNEEQEKKDLQPWERVSAAIGVAFFEKNKDEGVENVFKRADKAMYENKKAMKAVRS